MSITKKILLSTHAALVMSAAGEGAPAIPTVNVSDADVPAAPPAPPAAPVVQRQRQNGFTRPIAGTMTGLVWDIADEISAKEKRPAMRDEVWKEYQTRLAGANKATLSTQYSRWCGFHGVQEVLRKLRAKEKTDAAAAKVAEAEKVAAERAAKEAEKAKAAEAKAAEKAAKAAEAEKAKAEKAAAKAAEKAAKEAAAAAEREAKAKAAAEAAAAAKA